MQLVKHFVTARADKKVEPIYGYSLLLAAFDINCAKRKGIYGDSFQTKYKNSVPRDLFRSNIPSHSSGKPTRCLLRNNITSHIFGTEPRSMSGIGTLWKHPWPSQSRTDPLRFEEVGRVRKWLPRKATYTEGRDRRGCHVLV